MSNTQLNFENIDTSVKPLIKWAGGKTRLTSQLVSVADKALELLDIKKLNYYEPFFGGGALFFELHNNGKIDTASINDIIPHLISFYETVANENWIEELIDQISSLVETFNSSNSNEERLQHYGKVSENTGWVDEFNNLWSDQGPKNKDNKIKSAALFFMLNKTGFNGMFRLNNSGKFNIPRGDTEKVKFDQKIINNFKYVSKVLAKTSIYCGSYDQVLPPKSQIDKNTSFIYLDPPYIPNSDTADFTDYSKEGFDDNDHDAVSNLFHKLAKEGYKVVLSNNLNEKAKEKYGSNPNIFAYEVLVPRSIAKTKQGKRPPSKELLVSSFSLDSLGLQNV